jgi:hypothetical protein
MSRVRFDLNKDITLKQFTDGLDSASIKYEIDDKPNNFFPYYRAVIAVEDFTMWGSGIPWARELWLKQQHEDTAEHWGFA